MEDTSAMSFADNALYPADADMTIMFEKEGTSSQMPTPLEFPSTALQYDLISFLAIAQHLKIDFLPITWQPALENIGEGGTARIHQSLITLRLSFAFKRIKPSERVKWGETRIFQTLISEISILGNPSIRTHFYIAPLQGICWDISQEGTVWPVLVFEKAQFGNLKEFLKSERGQNLSLEERLDFCIDIGTAIRDMHLCHVIHGDIKPENVLIAKRLNAGRGPLAAQVTDFGYSTLHAGDGRLHMPYSKGWTAPEWYHCRGGFTTTFSNAVKMDLYSYALLCVWLLSNDCLEYILDQIRDGSVAYIESIFANKTLPPELKPLLISNLARDPGKRIFEFPTHLSTECSMIYLSSEIDFSLGTSLWQLYGADYRVRKFICNLLIARVNNLDLQAECRQNDALQVALCYILGFGIAKSSTKTRSYLDASERTEEDAREIVEKAKKENGAYVWVKFNKLVFEDGMTSMDFTDHYRQHKVLSSAVLEYTREIADIADTVGFDHTIVLGLRMTVSILLYDLGRWKEAEEMQVLLVNSTIKRQELGETSSYALSSMHHLAKTYEELGRSKEAEELNLKARERSLHEHGAEHVLTLMCTNNLAIGYMRQERFGKAEELFIQNMNASLKTLGEEHPFTILSMSNLSMAYQNNFNLDKAEKMQTEVIALSTRAIGAEHLDTLTYIVGKGSIYLDQKRWKEAEDLTAKVLQIRTRIMGAEHPQTLLCACNLASAYMHQERWDEAEKLLVQQLGIGERLLETDHLTIVTLQSNLASVHFRHGRYMKAEKLYEEIVRKQKQRLGLKHPNTLRHMGDLAETYEVQGRYKEATALMLEVLACCVNVQRLEHPASLAILDRMRSYCSRHCVWESYEKMETMCLKISSNDRGAEHPSTLRYMAALASVYGLQGKMLEAIALYEEVLKLQIKVLGEDHEDTKHSHRRLQALKAELVGKESQKTGQDEEINIID